MARHPRLATRTVDETMDVQDESHALLRLIRHAMRDGEVSIDEARSIHEQAVRIEREAREAVQAAERTDVGELLADSGRFGVVPNYLVKRAAEVGLPVVVLHPAVPEPVEFLSEDAA